MADKFIFHHIGVAVPKIEGCLQWYKSLGYNAKELMFDAVQNVNICFLCGECRPLIELVEPVDISSPINDILKKWGG